MKYDFADAPVLDSEEEAGLIASAQAGDKQARRRLMDSGLPWVVIEAGKKRRKSRADVNDLVAEGVVGLSRAIDSFDLGRGSRLQCYAVAKIRGEIGDYLRDRLPMFRRGGRSPDWIVRNWPGEVVKSDQFHLGGIPARDGNEAPTLPGWVSEAMDRLPPRERYALSAGVGLEGSPMTLADIGKELGVCEHSAWISRQIALRHIRASVPVPGRPAPAFVRPKRGPDPIRIAARGLCMTIEEWAAHLGVTSHTLHGRKKRKRLTWPEVMYPRCKGSDESTWRPGPAGRFGRPPRPIVADGESMTAREWADRLGVTYQSLKHMKARSGMGWPEFLSMRLAATQRSKAS